MFAAEPIGSFAILQFPDPFAMGVQLYSDPEVALVVNEPRSLQIVSEYRYIDIAFEPRRLEVSDQRTAGVVEPRERMR